MSREREEERPTQAADAAAWWFTRLQDEATSGEDWLEFEQWLGASPAHAAAYERLESLWTELDGVKAEVAAALDAPVSLGAYRAARARRPGVSRRVWLGAGAAMAASLVAGVIGVSNLSPVTTASHETAPGETRQLALADGTKVWLNAGSHMEVRFERRARRVEMADGEAVFDVMHDPRRPFLIDTGDREVRVVGTRFNLRQRADAFALTVSRGVVEVRPSGAPGAAPMRVTAGQRLVHRQGAPSAVVTSVDPDSAFAWTRGQLVYSDAPLSEVAADLSRSLATTVQVADAATGRMRFTGVLALDDKDAVIRRLEAFASVRAERGPQGVVLRPRQASSSQ